MACERRLIPVLLRNRHLPVTPQCVKQREDIGGTQTVDAVIHAREGIRIRDLRSIQASEVHTETLSPILLGSQKHRARPLSLRRLDNAGGKLVLDLLAYLLSFVRPGTVRLHPHRVRAWLEMDTMLGGFDGPKLTFKYGGMLLQCGHDFPA